jgi:hypothetical protein
LGKTTILLGGDHQSIGSLSSNQGKIPLLYAKINLSGDKSPPMAKIPSKDASSAGGKYNSLVKKYILQIQ